MALTAYFDASGHEHDQRLLCVAGFVSSGEQWIEFDKLWTARLAEDGIKCFHAVDFEHSSKEFKGWRKQYAKRNRLREDLMSILKSHVFRQFNEVVIVKALAQNMSTDTKRQYHINAYSLAGRACAARLRMWLERERWNTMPEFVFEDGDIGKGLLMSEFERDGFPRPVFKPKKDRVLKGGSIELGVTSLQAADWLAYESFVTNKNFDDTRQLPDRWAWKEFESTSGANDAGIFTPDDVTQLEEMMKMSQKEIVIAGVWDQQKYG